jgi:hypothetical protein
MIVRDVLEKAARFQGVLGPESEPDLEDVEVATSMNAATDEDTLSEVGVVIELIPPDRPVKDPPSAIRGR